MPTMSTAVSQSSQTGFSPMQGEDQRHSIPGTTSDKVQPRPSHSHSHSDDLDPVTADSSGTEYPPQKHAGKTGLGPHYYEEHRATFQDKVHGLREELEGEIKHNEKLWQQGHERISGELKEKQRKEEEKNDPFHKGENEDQKTTDKSAATLEHKDKGHVPKENKNKEYENKA